MKIEQKEFKTATGWSEISSGGVESTAYQLVLAFGRDQLVTQPDIYTSLKSFYPNANIIIASDTGEIMDVSVSDQSISVTALCFEKTSLFVTSEPVSKTTSDEVGKNIANKMPKEGLKHILIISEWLDINGSALIKWIREAVWPDVTMSGGLAGDNMKFVKTYVSLNKVPDGQSTVVLVWFYGEELKIGLGSIWGWDKFGPQRIITRSEGNTVFEIDGQPALDLYKTYLWEFAKDLPGSGLLFPLSIQAKNSDITLVRTLLSIDEAAKSVTYAWDVPQGSIAWLMKANFERVIDGAGQAVRNGIDMIGNADFGLLISCAGRKEILKQRVEEEIENVRYIVGNDTKISGFYSFGEIAPMGDIKSCYLHNQTMTVTLFKE